MMIVNQRGNRVINLANIVALRASNYNTEDFYINAQTVHDETINLGMYSTKEKAMDALQDLLKHVDWVQVKSEQKEEESGG